MWRNYLTMGFRVLMKNRAYALINILGLALGLAACVTILLFVRYEQGYDAALPGADRAFQLQQGNPLDAPGGSPGTTMTSFVSGTALRKDFPQFDRVVYVGRGQPVVLQDGQASTVRNFVYVDGPLFDIVQFPFLKGDRATALDKPGSMVLTESEAARRFGSRDPIGRTLTLVAGGKQTDYRVTGVIADPKHSHMALSMVARFDPHSVYAAAPEFLTQWMAKNGWVYARLRPGADVAEITRQMPDWKKRNIPDQIAGGERVNPGEGRDWALTNIRDVHLGVRQDSAMTPGNDARTIATFVVIALLILGMAIVNFVNLATARAGMRAREVALRKVVGASRRQLVVQFLGESLLLTSLAMLIGLTLVELALPLLNALLQTDMVMRYLGADGMLPEVLGLLLAVGIAGGAYPAFYLSRFKPAAVLHANRSAADTPGSGRIRSVLVVGQFAVAIGLFICTSIIAAQTNFARTTDPGYQRDGLMQVANLGRRQILPYADTLVQEIGRVPGVKSVGRSTIGVATWGMDNMTVTAPGASEAVELNLYRTDTRFFETMGIPMIAGRGFSATRATDDSTIDFLADDPAPAYKAMAQRGYGVVINAQAAKLLGFRTPADAVGKVLKADDGDVEANGQTPVTIIGVAGDARLRSVRDPLEPMIFLYDRMQPSWLIVRYQGSPAEARAKIEAVWKRIVPDAPFDAQFSSDVVRELYDADEARSLIFAGFSALAVVIGCLGLFGLASFMTQRRTKEIGIRKVVGARTRDIVRLLMWQFSKPVVLANLIAWPVAWWAMRDWLNSFDTRIELTPGPFAVAGILAFLIAAATVAGQSIRVARMNPIHALRYE